MDQVVALATSPLSDPELAVELVKLSGTEPRETVERGLSVALKLGVFTSARSQSIAGELQRITATSAELFAASDPEVVALKSTVAALKIRQRELTSASPAGAADIARQVIALREKVASTTLEIESAARERANLCETSDRAERLLGELMP